MTTGNGQKKLTEEDIEKRITHFEELIADGWSWYYSMGQAKIKFGQAHHRKLLLQHPRFIEIRRKYNENKLG